MGNLKKNTKDYSKARVVYHVTPLNDITWWVKWGSSFLILGAIILRALDILHMIDVTLSFLGCSGWIFVGFKWQDRSIMFLNTVAATILLMGLLKEVMI